MSDELTLAQPAAPTTTATSEIPADAWGQPISAERQAWLQGYLDRWQAETDHGNRKGPFDYGDLSPEAMDFPELLLEHEHERLQLTGADVFWLVTQKGRIGMLYGATNVHLEGADLHEAHLKGAYLHGVHLEGADLHEAHLEEADLSMAHLEEAFLLGAHLEGATLSVARLGRTSLRIAHLEGADLSLAGLKGADLGLARLEGADLHEAKLAGANLSEARLGDADLHGAWLDGQTVLNGAALDKRTRLGDIQWSGVAAVNLTQINWRPVHSLGDEQGVGPRSDIAVHEAAVRAYRQLAAQLRAQGMSEAADRFIDRAQVRQRKLLFRQMLADWRRPWRLPGDLVRWLFSWFLALLAGYGYHPGRSVFWYFATIAGFAFMYMQATRGWIPFGLPAPSQLAPLPWYEALILSVSSFHGRGFFQPLQSLGDPIAALAAIEAVIGLLIEISFIATFTQRFFGSR